MTARTRVGPRRAPRKDGDSGPLDFRHVHRKHMEASKQRDELLEQSKMLLEAGKIRAARAAFRKAESIHEEIGKLEASVKSIGPYARRE